MNYLNALLITLVNILLNLAINAQTYKPYVKFSETPDKRINSTDLESTNFFVEYKSKKKATIQIELIKDGKSYAYAKEVIKSKDKSVTKLNIIPKEGTKIIPGAGYSIKLIMFEGEKNNAKNLISETIINDINLSRLMYTKI